VGRQNSAGLAGRSERWAKAADDLRYLEESLCQTAALVTNLAHDPDGLRDTIVQSLEFLLRSAAGALRSGSPGDAEVLATLTSNRSKTLEAMLSRSEHTPPEGLELISIYFRCVYFLGHIAEALTQEVAGAVR
jgi:hypothetical protein